MLFCSDDFRPDQDDFFLEKLITLGHRGFIVSWQVIFTERSTGTLSFIASCIDSCFEKLFLT